MTWTLRARFQSCVFSWLFLFFSPSPFLSFFLLLLYEHSTLFRRASQLPINMFATAYATRCVIIPFNKIQFDLWTICASWIIDITMEKREQSAICCGQTENIPHQRPIMCKFSLSVDVFFCFIVHIFFWRVQSSNNTVSTKWRIWFAFLFAD